MPTKVRFKTQLKQIARLKDKQVSRAKKATAKTLERFGAIIRQDARKLIGPVARGPKFTEKVVDGRPTQVVTPAPPPRPAGKPPKARNASEAASIRAIIYDAKPDEGYVRIGPRRLSQKGYGGKLIPELHEFGGVVSTKVIIKSAEPTQQNLRKRKGQLTQVTSRVIYVESKRGKPVIFKMPKRPFMRPAFDRHKKKATKIWKEYYKAMRGRR